MNKSTLSKGLGVLFAAGLLSLSPAVLAEINISGWINEGIVLYDDGEDEETVQTTDNGTTLASRITFAGSTELGGGGEAGFEVIIQPQSDRPALIFSDQTNIGGNGHSLSVLGNSMYVKGAAGKLTVGLQSMPTDNIAVLEDPSLTLWSGISPVFRANGFTVRGIAAGGTARTAPVAAGPAASTAATTLSNDATAIGIAPVVGSFLNCFTATGLRGAGGIGIDCNGIYRQGVRYDLPSFGPISVAVGWANSGGGKADIYDIALKYKGNLGRLTNQFAIGYAVNTEPQGVNFYDEADNLQFQWGLMDPVTGLFGSFAYQHEEADLTVAANPLDDNYRVGTPTTNALCSATTTGMTDNNCYLITPGNISDESDAWWIKVGIKKQFFSVGDTSFAVDFGLYEDQYGLNEALNGVNGSEVERIGLSVDQYFGKSLIIYGKWEQLEFDVDGSARAQNVYNGADELSTLTLGGVYFF